MADEPVSRILYGAALASLLRDDHSSSPGLATGIERPTRGFVSPHSLRRRKRSRCACAQCSASRASSALLFGLAPRGVCRAPDVATGAVGSYPTFSPLPALQPFEDVPKVFLRAITGLLRRRYILCGTVRDACSRRLLTRHATNVPWRYQARCPIPAPVDAGL